MPSACWSKSSVAVAEVLAPPVACQRRNSVHDADEAARLLTRGVAHGRSESVAAFYEQWFDFALCLARRASGRDESVALDLVQDVMIKAARSMPELDSRAAIERWLTRVICNAAVDQRRSERRRRRREARAELVAPLSTDADAAEWMHAQLSRLDEEDAMLVRLRYAGAMKLRAVGEAMNVSTDAARGRLRNALAVLRRRAEKGDADAH